MWLTEFMLGSASVLHKEWSVSHHHGCEIWNRRTKNKIKPIHVFSLTYKNSSGRKQSFHFLSWQAKNYIRSLPKVPKKDLHSIFSKASSNGTQRHSSASSGVGALNSVMLTLICMSATQPCLSWKRCCFWTLSRGWAPRRRSTCPSSVSSETPKRRLKRCLMIRPWTTQTCRWTSGNVRERREAALQI